MEVDCTVHHCTAVRWVLAGAGGLYRASLRNNHTSACGCIWTSWCIIAELSNECFFFLQVQMDFMVHHCGAIKRVFFAGADGFMVHHCGAIKRVFLSGADVFMVHHCGAIKRVFLSGADGFMVHHCGAIKRVFSADADGLYGASLRSNQTGVFIRCRRIYGASLRNYQTSVFCRCKWTLWRIIAELSNVCLRVQVDFMVHLCGAIKWVLAGAGGLSGASVRGYHTICCRSKNKIQFKKRHPPTPQKKRGGGEKKTKASFHTAVRQMLTSQVLPN